MKKGLSLAIRYVMLALAAGGSWTVRLVTARGGGDRQTKHILGRIYSITQVD